MSYVLEYIQIGSGGVGHVFSESPEGASHWTMQTIADELICLEVVDYITDTTGCEVMKK